MDYKKEQVDYFMKVFSDYEKKFDENLFGAWNFDDVDWLGLAKVAEQCIKSNTAMTDEQKSKFFEPFEEGQVY